MAYPLAFFSFVVLQDASTEDHRRYNEWHQLDHRPENLALPGVAWGDRWARTKAHSASIPEYDAVDYVAMYWFREPTHEAVASWNRLAADSFQWGRGPLLPGVHRPLLGFFHPVKGYVAQSALVSPDVLPYRPNRGVHVTLSRFIDPFGYGTHNHHAWEDRTLIPAICDIDGVAGAWTFTFSHHEQDDTLPEHSQKTDAPGSMRMRLTYIDGDLASTIREVRRRTIAMQASRSAAAVASEQTLLDTELKTIVPWLDW